MAHMPRPRTQQQRQEVVDFIHLLYEHGQFDAWASFAKAAGVNPTEMSDWKLGRNVPDGYNLLRLIHASQIMTSEGPPMAMLPREAVSILNHLEALVISVAENPALLGLLGPALQETAAALRRMVEAVEPANIAPPTLA